MGGRKKSVGARVKLYVTVTAGLIVTLGALALVLGLIYSSYVEMGWGPATLLWAVMAAVLWLLYVASDEY